MEVTDIISLVCAVLVVITGTSFALKYRQAVKLLKEIGEAFTTTAEALEDKDVTKEEAVEMLKEWRDVVSQVLKLIGKK